MCCFLCNRFGIYPITNFGLSKKSRPKNHSIAPESSSSAGATGGRSSDKKESDDKVEDDQQEHRRISQAFISVGPSDTNPGKLVIIIVLRFLEGRNRIMTTEYRGAADEPNLLADDLISEKVINPVRENQVY